ncbi:MAG: DnaJ domain-containing protein [Acidimicrobiia bacterium]
MLHREWIECDFYADLGVARDATAEEISEAYRTRARNLHPDRNPGDPEAETRFKALSRAYSVLGNTHRRAQYNAARDRVFDRGVAPTPGTTRPEMRSATPRRALTLRPSVGFVLAAICLASGLGISAWIVIATRSATELRRRGNAATGVVVSEAPIAQVRFTTSDGEVVTAAAPRARDRRNGGYRLGEAVALRYDSTKPTHLVADESQTARVVTMWIIAIKLLVCGLILGAMAWYRMRRPIEGGWTPSVQRQPLPNPTNGT